jgi:hypothetical protein
MIKIFSKLCCLDNITATDEQMKMNLNILRSYASIWYAKNNCSSLMIDEIKKVLLKLFIFIMQELRTFFLKGNGK